jgi:hypothetical protein
MNTLHAVTFTHCHLHTGTFAHTDTFALNFPLSSSRPFSLTSILPFFLPSSAAGAVDHSHRVPPVSPPSPRRHGLPPGM